MKPGLVSPLASLMADVYTDRTSPISRVPVMIGLPVGRALGGRFTVFVAALVAVSAYPLSSVKSTRTLMVWTRSSVVGVYVALVAPGIWVSLLPSLRTHW